MAAVEISAFALPSLFQTSTKAVITHLDSYGESLRGTPESIKQAILRLMSKRGLITDQNVDKVLYTRLRALDLSTSQVTDRCLFKLSRMAYLCKVDLNSFKEPNDAITSAGIISLSKSCPNLQIVYLRRNINVTDEGIITLCQNCPYLRELNVGGCSLLTDASLKAIGEHSRHMRSLNISVMQATDVGIDKLCEGLCSQVLTEIDMSGCKNLTDEAVEIIVMKCPLIRILLFARCPKITDNARLALEEKVLTSDVKMKQVSWTIY